MSVLLCVSEKNVCHGSVSRARALLSDRPPHSPLGRTAPPAWHACPSRQACASKLSGLVPAAPAAVDEQPRVPDSSNLVTRSSSLSRQDVGCVTADVPGGFHRRRRSCSDRPVTHQRRWFTNRLRSVRRLRRQHPTSRTFVTPMGARTRHASGKRSHRRTIHGTGVSSIRLIFHRVAQQPSWR